MSELLPCPFCGGEADIFDPDMEPGYVVGCDRCDAVMDVHYASKAEAIAAAILERIEAKQREAR